MVSLTLRTDFLADLSLDRSFQKDKFPRWPIWQLPAPSRQFSWLPASSMAAGIAHLGNSLHINAPRATHQIWHYHSAHTAVRTMVDTLWCVVSGNHILPTQQILPGTPQNYVDPSEWRILVNERKLSLYWLHSYPIPVEGNEVWWAYVIKINCRRTDCTV
jgi:hypothetical protein